MKKPYAIILCIMAIIGLISFSGCESLKGSCFTVEAGKGEYKGGFTYCFDSKQAAEVEAPVFTEKKESGESEEIFGFRLDEINKILDKLKGKDGPAVKSLNNPRHPVAQLKEFLK